MLTKILAFGPIILVILLISNLHSFSQSVVPTTVNAGGGNYASGYYQFDWSVGEGASINSFITPGNFIITGGVLQPYTSKTGTIDYSTTSWAADEISIFPIPAHNTLEVNIKLAATGKVNMNLIDQRGNIVISKSFNYNGTNGIQKFNITAIASGTYYLNVILEKTYTPIVRKGSFKIQKF